MCSIFGVESKSIPVETLKEHFDRTLSRGPDMSRMTEIPCGYLGFHRLAIMGLNKSGMQPFERDGSSVVCNGELYGFRPLKKRLEEKYAFQSDSDCEILLPLYEEYGLEMFKVLDAEFALILYDGKTGKLIAARDPIGIRPLYYGTLADGWQAYCIGVGMCAYVYLGQPDNKELRDRLYAQLKVWAEAGIYGFRQVFTVEETEAAEGLGGDFSFVLETDGYTGFGTACEGPYVKPNSLHEDYHYAHGKHGYLPDKGPQPVFVAKGPDFASGNALVPFCRLVDEAPTFASLLGVSMPEADGKPVLEILK